MMALHDAIASAGLVPWQSVLSCRPAACAELPGRAWLPSRKAAAAAATRLRVRMIVDSATSMSLTTAGLALKSSKHRKVGSGEIRTVVRLDRHDLDRPVGFATSACGEWSLIRRPS